MKKCHIKLSQSDREFLKTILVKGIHRSRVFKRSKALLELDKGSTLKVAAEKADTTYVSVSKWRDRYNQEGLESAIYDKKRSGRPREIDGLERAKVTALAASDPPEGYSQWSLRLLADKAVELGYCEHIGRSSVSKILKKTD